MQIDEIPEQFTKRYWKVLQFEAWAFQKYFPLIFEYLANYTGPLPTIEQAEAVVIATHEQSVEVITRRQGISSAWLPPEVTRKLAQQLRNHLIAQRASAVPKGGSQTHSDSQAHTNARRRRILEAILNNRGLSSHAWAVQAEVSWHTVDSYLNGKTQPTKDTRKRLANALGMEPQDLPE